MVGIGRAALREDALVVLRDVERRFRDNKGRTVHAVSGVSLDVRRGEALGVVGESGCGKSTMARATVLMPPPTQGSVHFDGRDLGLLSKAELRRVRPKIQMVFQDPESSLDPRWSVRRSVAEPMSQGRDRQGRVDELLTAVGLDPAVHGDAKPSTLSGGQCQRVAIARALAAKPEVVIFDEPVSALDVLVQAQIIELLKQLRTDLDLTFVFIAHDLAVVEQVCDRVAVMYMGRLCEVGATSEVYGSPRHPYTSGLLAAVPKLDPDARTVASIQGDPPSPVQPPSGCRFRARCPRASAICETEIPELQAVGPDHVVACHHPSSTG